MKPRLGLFVASLWLLCVVQAEGAIVATGLTAGGKGATCETGQATTSITPTANALVLACVMVEVGTAPVGTVSLTGNGLTWVEVGAFASGANNSRVALFRASGPSPTAGAVTLAFTGSHSGCTWAIGEFTGQDTGGTNGSSAIVQSNSNGASSIASLTVTLSAFGSTNNVAVGCFGNSANATTTPGTGFTEVIAQASGFPSRAVLISDANDVSVDVTAATTTLLGVAAEIKIGGGRKRFGPRLLWNHPLFAPVRLETVAHQSAQ